MKARIYQPGKDYTGTVLSGEVIDFYLGTEGWNLTLKDGKQENNDFYDEIIKYNERKPATILKEANPMKELKTKMVINENGTIWIGFSFSSGYRVQIYESKDERTA